MTRSGRLVRYAAANAAVLAYLFVAAAWMVAGEPGWLLVHLVLLGAATNAIVTWSGYFTATLLRAQPPEPRAALIRLAALNVGVVAVLVGVEQDWDAVAVSGAVVVAGVIVEHALATARAVRAGWERRFAPSVRFYVVAAGAVLLGVSGGVALVLGVPAGWQPRVYAAHVQLNVLGWVTLTVLGTEFTLWPTVLRTRLVPGAERAARLCLPGCAAGLGLVVGGVLTATRPVTVAGFAVYLLFVAVALDPFVRTALQRTPRSPATWMLAASTAWLLVALCVDTAAAIRSGEPGRLAGRFEDVVPWLVAGFVVQVLIGALTYLLPVVLGGPPNIGRRTAAVLDSWGRVRVVALNVGVGLVAWDVSWGWWVSATAVAWFVGLAAVATATRLRR